MQHTNLTIQFFTYKDFEQLSGETVAQKKKDRSSSLKKQGTVGI